MLRPSGWLTPAEFLAARPSATVNPASKRADEDFWEDREVADPARVTTAIMLGDALERADLSIDEAGADGIVVAIRVPDAEWTDVMVEQWSSWLRQGERPTIEGLRGRSRTYRYSVWSSEKPHRKDELHPRNANFAMALAHGDHCLGLAADLAWLPSDLIATADHTITCPPLSPEQLDEAIGVTTSGSAQRLSEADAARVTPRLLRLARRATQDAGTYTARLRQLLASDVARAKTGGASAGNVSPRGAPRLDRLHGMNAAVAWGTTLARDIAAYRAGRIAWSEVDRGCLLSGPPGCGKTLFARALAATCEVPLFSGSYGEWIGSGNGWGSQGDLLRGMRACFSDARTNAPSIVFIDEIDSFPKRATVARWHAEWTTEVVNALLGEIDGVAGRDGVVVIGACNHPNKMDPALVRSGRLDRHITIGLPDDVALARILREHLGADVSDADLSDPAVLAIGSTGADCERYARGARRRARDESRAVRLDDLRAEIGGAEPSGVSLRLLALHEAGHAVVNAALWPGRWQAASLRQTAREGGAVLSAGMREPTTRAHVHRLLMQSLAGRAAEEVGLGIVSSGAGGSHGSDLADATTTATRALVSYGLGRPEPDLLWLGHPEPRDVRELLQGDPALAARVREWLQEAYANVLALLMEHGRALEAVAGALARERALDGARIAELVASNAPVAS